MAEADHLKELKSAARKIARARRIKHVGALDVVAKGLGYAHWHAVAVAEKKGWRPTPNDVAAAYALADAENPLISIDTDPFATLPAGEFQGELLGHAYQVSAELDDVRVWGRGWELVLPEAPLAPPRFRKTDRRLASTPIDDAEFCTAVAALASDWRKRIHARIASDWPRRSTVPDSQGRAQHPLFHSVGREWQCLHCDSSWSSAEITANLFHCADCLASPIDIHVAPEQHADHTAV